MTNANPGAPTSQLQPPRESPPPADAGDVAMSPELRAYFADRRQVWRNVLLISLGWMGHGLCFTIVTPLTQLHQAACGIGEGAMGWMVTINQWLLAFLVMYFSWRSDRTVHPRGRRIPYLLISLPFIVVSVILTPFFDNRTSLILLASVGMLFLDMKLSTYSLLIIDCVPRDALARANAIGTAVAGITAFVATRWGVRLAGVAEWLPFVVCGGALAAITGIAGLLIREPPVRNPSSDSFRPWSALAIGWKDRRAIVLMLGVGLVFGFLVIQESWVWLFAKHALGLTREDTATALSWAPLLGVVLAYPIGWAIDRLGLMRMTAVFLVLQLLACLVLIRADGAGDLVAFSMIMVVTYPLYAAADIMVYKHAPPEEMGSVTSSNSFLRNLLRGGMGLVGAYIIAGGDHDYRTAFLFGAGVSVVGFALIFIHHHYLVRRAPNGAAESVAVEIPASAVP